MLDALLLVLHFPHITTTIPTTQDRDFQVLQCAHFRDSHEEIRKLTKGMSHFKVAKSTRWRIHSLRGRKHKGVFNDVWVLQDVGDPKWKGVKYFEYL